MRITNGKTYITYLVLFSVEIGNLYDNPDTELARTRSSFSTLTLRKKGRYMSAWNIIENFTFRVSAMCRLNCDSTRNVEVRINVSLYVCLYVALERKILDTF